MPAKRFNEADIDFDALDDELAKLEPPKLSLTVSVIKTNGTVERVS